jgi:hypothetical protein
MLKRVKIAPAQSEQKDDTAVPCSSTLEEPQVESREYENNANVHRQPFLESDSNDCGELVPLLQFVRGHLAKLL